MQTFFISSSDANAAFRRRLLLKRGSLGGRVDRGGNDVVEPVGCIVKNKNEV